MGDMDISLIFGLVMVGVIAHAALLLASRWVRPMLITAAGYVVVSPLSAATLLPHFGVLKYIRVYITILIIVIGMMAYRRLRLGAVSLALFVAISFYALAGLWGPNVTAALMYKGLLVLAIISGALVGGTIGSIRDLREMVRALTVGAAVLCGVFLAAYVASPESISHIGRFHPWGINPNRVGQSCAPLAVIAIYSAFNDSSKRFRLFAIIVLGLLGFLVIITGSRGAIGMAVIGSFIVMFPMIRRPFLVGTVLLFVMVGANIAISSVEAVNVERIGKVNFDSRDEPWTDAFDYIRRSPFYGHGWVRVEDALEGGTRNFHSIYLQLVVESGIGGLALFVAFMILGAMMWSRHLLAALRSAQGAPGAVFFGGGLMASIFAHGFIESGTLMGSTVNVLLLGVSAGLADRFRWVLHHESQTPSLQAFEPMHPGYQWTEASYGLEYGSEPEY